MKLEREPVFGQLSYKPEFKSFDHNEINLNSRGLDSANWIGKDNGEEDCQIDALNLSATNVDRSKSAEDLKTCNKGEINGFVPEKLEFLEKQTDCYMDSRVMEYDLPELVVCYKESSCNTIKDICVDEGVPSQEKIWFETKMDEKAFCNHLSPDEVQKEQVLQHQTDIVTSIPEDFKASVQKYDVKEESEIPSNAEELMQSGEVMYDSSAKTTENDLSTDDCTHSFNSKSSSNTCLEAEKDTVQISKDMGDDIEDTHGSPLVPAEWESLLKPDPVPSAIELNRQVEELSNSSEVENGSIAVGVDHSAPVSISRFANLDERSNYRTDENSSNASTCGLNYSDIAEDVYPENGSSRHLETPILAEVDSDDMHESRISSEVRPSSPGNGALQHPETSNMSIVDDDISDSDIVSQQVQHSSVLSAISEDVCPKDVDYTTQNVPIQVQHESRESSFSVGVPFATLINVKESTPYADTHNASSEVQHDQGESSFSAAVGNSSSLITSSGPIPYSDSDRFLVQRDLGDSSFAALDHVASLVNSSGPIPYSGSISLRSDGSAASTRSFSFPIMYHHDPYGSPVRMAKADRRLLRKHRGWKRGVFCCSF